MSDTKISVLPSASSLTGAERLPVVQSNQTRGATVTQIWSQSSTLTASVSVVTPAVTPASGALSLGLTGQSVLPAADNTIALGSSTFRWTSLFAGTIDTGSTSSLFLKTQNGITSFKVSTVGADINFVEVFSHVIGNSPQIRFTGTDTDVGASFFTKGVGTYTFSTNIASPVTQFQILHTASSSRNITVTGSNGGNPVIDVTAGALKLSGGTSDIQWGKANVALGGGAAPTLGTIGGSGPAAAAQRNWLRFIESDGTASFIPVWR